VYVPHVVTQLVQFVVMQEARLHAASEEVRAILIERSNVHGTLLKLSFLKMLVSTG